MKITTSILFVGAVLTSAAGFAQDYSLMTFNIRRKGSEKLPERCWQNRMPAMQKFLQMQHPDIIGFQEVTPDQWEDLKKMLPEYESIGKGRGTAWLGAGKDEATPLFYNKNKFELIAHGTFQLNNNPHYAIFNMKANGSLARICTWGYFKDKNSGKSFYVLNTHLDHQHDQARANQLKKLITTLHEYAANTDKPVFLMGDFNTPLTPEIKSVISEFENSKEIAKEKSGPEMTAMSWGHDSPQLIDHILVKKNPNIIIKSHQVIDSKEILSDHRPVFCKIEIS